MLLSFGLGFKVLNFIFPFGFVPLMELQVHRSVRCGNNYHRLCFLFPFYSPDLNTFHRTRSNNVQRQEKAINKQIQAEAKRSLVQIRNPFAKLILFKELRLRLCDLLSLLLLKGFLFFLRLGKALTRASDSDRDISYFLWD
ncbi:unnamed protein product [Sphenostylis stenocarpa]|uniref:Uncharacterized protein n=1 Tax=Sphenostylis stenocarpa TaxID=92480 RepID=A0AA86VG90_9FABA|nr:unnamed protein product [Sphenostylis stenocarpa]